MIRKAPAFITSDNTPFFTAEEAQKHELKSLFNNNDESKLNPHLALTLANVIFDHKDRIIDILTTTAKSKPAARKINGGKKTRKTVDAITLIPDTTITT